MFALPLSVRGGGGGGIINMENGVMGYFIACYLTDNYIAVCHLLFFKNHVFTYLIRKEGRKEMFYLMTHSTHFIYGYRPI